MFFKLTVHEKSIILQILINNSKIYKYTLYIYKIISMNFFFNIDKNIIIKKILFYIFYGLIYFKYKNYNLLDRLIDKYIDINQKNLIFYHFPN